MLTFWYNFLKFLFFLYNFDILINWQCFMNLSCSYANFMVFYNRFIILLNKLDLGQKSKLFFYFLLCFLFKICDWWVKSQESRWFKFAYCVWLTIYYFLNYRMSSEYILRIPLFKCFYRIKCLTMLTHKSSNSKDQNVNKNDIKIKTCIKNSS